MRPCACPPRSERRRAVTLVELLVGMGIGVAVLVILLNTFDQTQRLAVREVRRNLLRQEALLSLHRISSVIGAAVPLSSLDASASTPEIFEPRLIQVASWSGATPQEVPICRISEETFSEIEPPAESDSPVPGQAGTSIAISRFHFDGSPIRLDRPHPGVDETLELEYATGRDPAGALAWSRSLGPGEFPALVRVRITTRSRSASEESFTVSSIIATSVESIP